jgi:hypothetical protein
MQSSDIQDIIEQLETLRVRRQEINRHIDQQQGELLQYLATGNSANLESDSPYPASLPDLEERPPSEESQVHLPPSTLQFHPISSNNSVHPGDRVKITNALRHISGPPSEEDRLATVVKVNAVFIEVRTDSGQVTKRIKKNLLKLSETSIEQILISHNERDQVIIDTGATSHIFLQLQQQEEE